MPEPLQPNVDVVREIIFMRERLDRLFDFYVENGGFSPQLLRIVEACDASRAIYRSLAMGIDEALSDMVTERQDYQDPEIHAVLTGALDKLRDLEEAMLLEDEGE